MILALKYISMRGILVDALSEYSTPTRPSLVLSLHNTDLFAKIYICIYKILSYQVSFL